jgi:hypothetical protein
VNHYTIEAAGAGSDGVASAAVLFRGFRVDGPAGDWPVTYSLPEFGAFRLQWDEAQTLSILSSIGIRRLEAELAQGVLERPAPGHVRTVRLSLDDDGDELRRAGGSKVCAYQRTINRSMYCSASTSNDEFAIGTEGMLVFAATTAALCAGCSMPSEDLACSALVHVQVHGRAVISPQRGERSVQAALCEAGQSGVRTDVSRCQAGGHGCWRREVTPEQRIPLAVSPLQLHEALDFLNATWRLRFGIPLLAPTAAAVAGGLGQPVETRDELLNRIGELVTTLEFRVPSELLPAEAGNTNGGINRAVEVMRAAGVDVPDYAVGNLRDIVDVKNALRHQGKAKDLGKHLDNLGIRTLWLSPSESWQAIASVAVVSLTAIRNAVRASELA